MNIISALKTRFKLQLSVANGERSVQHFYFSAKGNSKTFVMRKVKERRAATLKESEKEKEREENLSSIIIGGAWR